MSEIRGSMQEAVGKGRVSADHPEWRRRATIGAMACMVAAFGCGNGHADPMAECLRLSAVKAWQVSVTLTADGSGANGPNTTITSHQSGKAVALVFDVPVGPASCPADLRLQMASAVASTMAAEIDNTAVTHNPGPPPCDFLLTQRSAQPQAWVNPQSQLTLQFSSASYSLSLQSIAPIALGEHGCGSNKDTGGGTDIGPFGPGGPVSLIKNQPLPASGLVLRGQAQFSAPGDFSFPFQVPLTWTVNWDIRPVPVEQPKQGEETIDKSCQTTGSIIGCENQSLGEALSVSGTGLNLHYQSDRAPGRTLANPVAVEHARDLGGWTLSVHHRYDPTANSLFLGNGERRDAAALGSVKASLAGGFLIASENGDVVYEFAASGRHLRTLHGLTGAALHTFSYDAQARLTSIADGDANRTTIQRDVNGRPTAIVGPYGHTTRLAVDANGYLSSMTMPSGTTVNLTTTPQGLLTAYTNANKQTMKFAYDSKGRLTSDTDAAGHVQTLVRNEAADGFSVKLTTAEKRVSQYQVTPNSAGGEIRVITDAAGLATRISRATDGAESIALPDGTTSTQTLDPDPRFGRSAAIVRSQSIATPSGIELTITTARSVTLADPANPFSLTSLTDTATLNGRTYSSAYAGDSQTIVHKSPAGRTRQTTIDAQGRIANSAPAGLFPSTFAYDDRGRLSSVTQANGTDARTVQLSYGSSGLAEHVTDPLGRSVNFMRDGMGRTTQQTYSDGRAISYTYDANGNLTSVTPPGRPAHRITYSSVDRTATYVAPSLGSAATITKYSYNRDRQLLRVTQPGGRSITLSYDTAGRPATVKIKRGALSFAYYAGTGRMKSLTAPGGIGLAYTYDGKLLTGATLTGAVAGSVQFAYDNDSRVRQISINNANPLNFQFDPDGLLTNAGDLTLARDSQNGLLTGTALSKVTDSYTRNGFAETTVYSARFNAAEIFKTTYAYDKLGRITSQSETIAGSTNTFEYDYDAAGRLAQVKKNGVVQAGYTYDGNGNRLTRVAGGTPTAGTYDSQDRLTRYGTAIYDYTENGELQSRTDGNQKTAYAYDELGNLMSVSLPNATRIDYLVDARNRRIGKKVNGTLVQGFLYEDQLKPIAELDGGSNVVSRFVYATRVNVPDYMVKGGITYRIVTDHLGSPRLVVDATTGAVAQRIDYDEFGNAIVDTNPGFQPFGFAGGIYDKDTGLVRFGARDYDSIIGRWTAKDPVLFRGGDSNVFAYASLDPVNFSDYTGLILDYDYNSPEIGDAIARLWRNPVTRNKIRRMAADTIDVFKIDHGYNLKKQGGGTTGQPIQNSRGGRTCSSLYNINDHLLNLSERPSLIPPDDVDALIAHELGHAYAMIYGGDGDRLSIDWENAIRSETGLPMRPYYGDADGGSWHQWPR